jgi:hypothetical protein
MINPVQVLGLNPLQGTTDMCGQRPGWRKILPIPDLDQIVSLLQCNQPGMPLSTTVFVTLDVSEDSVCYWENNRVVPSPRMLARILSFLESNSFSSSRASP